MYKAILKANLYYEPFVTEMIKEELNSNRKVCLAECEHFDYLIEVAMGKLSKNADVKGLPFL